MRKTKTVDTGFLSRLLIVGVTAVALSACGNTLAESLGYGKDAPDEFAIVTKAPLVIPPDYALRPPRPGAAGPRATSPQVLARAVLLRSEPGDEGITVGEQALLANAGAANADPNIRAIIENETRALKRKDETFLAEVLFWQEANQSNRVVDAVGEAQRLRENEALGRPANDGETPDYDGGEGGGFIDYFFN